MLFLGARNALDVGATQVTRFGIGNGGKDELEQLIKETIKTYSLGIVKDKDISVKFSAYGNLDGTGAAPVEPFLDQNENKSVDINEFWVDLDANNKWDNNLGNTNSFNKRGIATRVRVSIWWDSFFPLFWKKINTEIPVPALNVDTLDG